MDSDPVDPTSSVVKRKTQVILSDSESEDESPPPRRSNGREGSKRRRTLSVSREDDDQEETNEDERRARKGKGGAVDGGEEENGEEEEDEEEGEVVDDGRPIQPQYRPEYERHPDGYVTGSITRIKLIDFMTYDFVEFYPGPHLNMILGPNGTGKSTIAAGIAIGLGFKPEIMGRATDLRSYVKQGKEVGWTEIEVRGPIGKRNHVIWRRFTREEKSEWKLNGQPATKKAIVALVGGFGIQANNLCCFLAQDRVAEFAKMSPPLTLKETMRAAGDPRLSEWHERLVSTGIEKKALDEKLNTDVVRRDQIKTQMDKIQPDVEQFENRQEMEKERDILTLMVLAAKTNVVKQQHLALEAERNAKKKEKKELEKRNEPLARLLKEHTRRENSASAKVKQTNDELRGSMSEIKNAQGKLTTQLDKCASADGALSSLKQKIKRRQDNKERMEKRKADALEKLEEDETSLSNEMSRQQQTKKELTSRQRQIRQHRSELMEKESDMLREFEKIGTDINAKMKRQNELEDVVKLRTEAAIRANGSIGFALDYIKKNGTRFEHPVGLPPMISVNVPQRQYAWQVEQCLNFAQKSTFICQSQNDYDLLVNLNKMQYPERVMSNGEIMRPGRVGLHLVTVDVRESNVNPQRMCSPQRLHELGLDGVAIDFVEAEPVVMAFLNEHCHLDRAAVTQRSSADLDSQTLASAGFWTWLSRDDSVRAIRSRYGQRKYQMTSQEPIPARMFNKSVDQEAVAQLAEEIADLKRRKLGGEGPLKQMSADLNKSSSERDKNTKDLTANEEEIKRIRKELTAFETARSNLDVAREELDRIATEPSEAEERDKLQAEKIKKALACLDNVNALATSHKTLATQASDSLTAMFAQTQSKINRTVIERKHVDTEKTERRLVKEIEALNKDLTRESAKFHTIYEKLNEELRKVNRVIRDEINQRVASYNQEVPLEPMEVALADATAQLELSEGISSNVVERFRRFEKEHDKLAKEVKQQEADLQKVTKSLSSILNKFEPALDSLVNTVSKRFTSAFDRNGCSGDVRLDKDERGYEHWGLIPHVSFRDGEMMQALTGHRQSGGERSYSTIMYLMALSEMARVPFSLVDEINQGMDQQAERTVFNQLVETTCDESAGQYFLITPKLLTGLTYHERMKVLIVNNGHWLPEGTDSKQKFGDLRGCLKKFRRSIAAH